MPQSARTAEMSSLDITSLQPADEPLQKQFKNTGIYTGPGTALQCGNDGPVQMFEWSPAKHLTARAKPPRLSAASGVAVDAAIRGIVPLVGGPIIPVSRPAW